MHIFSDSESASRNTLDPFLKIRKCSIMRIFIFPRPLVCDLVTGGTPISCNDHEFELTGRSFDKTKANELYNSDFEN